MVNQNATHSGEISVSGPRNKYTPAKKAERVERAHRAQDLMSASPSSANLIATSLFIREFVEREKRSAEPGLVDACWVEYAYMSPLKRTTAFTAEYLKVYRRFYEKYVDSKDAPFRCPIDETWAANEPGEMNSLWTARQHADTLGMPYSIFLGEALEFSAARGHKQFPRPNQLYNEALLGHLQAHWQSHAHVERLRLDEWDARFQVTNYAGDPAQARLHELVIERIKAKPTHIDINIQHYVLGKHPAIPISVAIERLGGLDVQSEVRRASHVPTQPDPDQKARYVRPCIGIAYNLDPAVCGACTVAALCAQVDGKVDQLALAAFGDVEPKRAADKKAARDRQRTRRAKLRAALESPGPDTT